MTVDKINDLALHNEPIRNELNDAIQRVLDSAWYALGPEVNTFESAFAEFCQVQYCKGVANGTDALEIALRALGVDGKGIDEASEVITVANAGMYSTCAILNVGAKPVYADVEEDSYNISVTCVEELISPKTSAIIATHLYGRMANMKALRKVADKYKIPLLEDCAQAHGAEIDGKKAGSWGDASAFSFYPTKNLGALGDGGAIITNSKEINDKVASLRQYGWSSKYHVRDKGGKNSRLDELQAAILSAKLKHLPQWTKQRQTVAERYSTEITHVDIVNLNNSVVPYVASHVYHLYVIAVKEEAQRESLIKHLKATGIASDIHYPLLDYQQAIFDDCAEMKEIHLANSERIVSTVLTIPCYPELQQDEVTTIIHAINNWNP